MIELYKESVIAIRESAEDMFSINTEFHLWYGPQICRNPFGSSLKPSAS